MISNKILLESRYWQFNFKKFCRRAFCSSNEIIFQTINKCGSITINRPNALNALNQNVINEMKSILEHIKTNNNINHILIKGNGRAFCSGGDVVEIITAGKSSVPEAIQNCRNEYLLDYLLATFPKPCVSLIDGITIGGGCGISMYSDYVVSTNNTKLAMPETTIGFFTDCGAGYFLSKLRNNIGVFMALTGHRLIGRQVYDFGLSTHHIHSDKKEELIEQITNSRDDDELKRVIEKCHFIDENEKEALLPEEDIKTIFGAETIEDVFTRLNDKINDETAEKKLRSWCEKELNLLKKKSPTSLKVTLKYLINCHRLDLQQVLHMDCRIAEHMLYSDDFYEGVRALLIDKTNNPSWNPASIEDITDKDVNQYFSPVFLEESFLKV